MFFKKQKYVFKFLHDCNDCKYINECSEEKSFSKDCDKFEYNE